MAVALPKILTQVDSIFTDTVFISSANMKVAKDLKVYLHFYDDGNHHEVLQTANIDTAGYKYKSRWIANSNLAPGYQKPYYRQFPANSTTYRRWNKTAGGCEVTFNHDSLYAVGGKLTIECKGAMKQDTSIKIDNRFRVVTDTLAANHTDTLQTKRILIDKDPVNALFYDSLNSDIIKAIAWEEYAGSNDAVHHCHNPYNPQYNNYWDRVISQGDTCVDSLAPCENTVSTATGIMQIARRWHAADFRSNNHIPSGYQPCIWDSLAWNWKIAIHNGKYLYFTENFYNINKSNYQKNLDSLYFPANDYSPDKPNKEDLAVYGYHWGLGNMGAIIDSSSWVKYVMKDDYVNDVRKYKDTKPWNR